MVQLANREAPLRVLAGAAGLATAGLLYSTVIERNAFALRHTTLSVLEPGATPLRVLHISDIHLLPDQHRKLAFLEHLESLRPHLVIDTGDNIASAAAVPALAQAIEPLLRQRAAAAGLRVRLEATTSQRPGAQQDGEPRRFVAGEVAGDDARAAGDVALDHRGRDHLVVQNDREGLADIGRRIGAEALGALRVEPEIDRRLAVLVERGPRVGQFLAGDDRWTAPDLSGVDVVAQPHCHHHGVMGWSPDAALLRDAGANLQQLGGCCGLAGNFGVEKGHYEVSVAVAQTALLPALQAAGDDATVLADGFSCQTQIADLSERTGVHLVELLARGA